MSRYRKFAVGILAAYALIILFFNIIYFQKNSDSKDKPYRVEAERIADELMNKGIDELKLSEYDTIKGVYVFDASDTGSYDYVVVNVGGVLYRIDYEYKGEDSQIFFMNGILLLAFSGTFCFLFYIGKTLVIPFDRMSNLTVELAKGNLTVPIPEEKSHFFGKFLWSMDMLRDKLEDDRERELALLKEKKETVISLTHDIKTPLSAISLYTRAISENLYTDEEKKTQALAGITHNVEIVEGYINDIARSEREDFLNIDVTMGEFYLWDALDLIETYYRDKLALLHTEFTVKRMDNCLVRGDEDRFVEAVQNAMENAIKYGDGKRITISENEEEDCRLITIHNSGNSLNKEELNNIFDSFYRGTNSGNIKGSGLGLYIAKKLMSQMEADVYADIKDNEFLLTIVVRKA